MDNKDYVFKKTPGKIEYVGDFDGLYKNVKDPWGQLSNEYYKNRSYDVIEALRDINPSDVLDIGCGLGLVTQLIQILITDNVIGVDISREAVGRAKKMYPTVSFNVLDIINNELPGKFDAITMSGVLWYILHDLDMVMAKIRNALPCGGHLVIFQTFINDQFYGKDIIDGYKGWLKYLDEVKDFKIVKSLYRDTGSGKQDSMTVLKVWGEK